MVTARTSLVSAVPLHSKVRERERGLFLSSLVPGLLQKLQQNTFFVPKDTVATERGVRDPHFTERQPDRSKL